MFLNTDAFQKRLLDDSNAIYLGQLPSTFLDQTLFEEIWQLHPEHYHLVKILGKEIPTPRWQQAYGRNYNYTGAQQNALPIPFTLKSFQDWTQENIHPELNGLLLNWYDAQKKHYIGPHRDAMGDLKTGSPIVTISLGEARIFRFRPWRGKGYLDFPVGHGAVLIIPWESNKTWTHEVPHFKRYQGRRISITLRIYDN